MNNKIKIKIIGTSFCVTALFSCVGFIFWTVIPHMQGREYLKKAKIAYTPDVIIDDKFIFEPMTNIQGLIRYMLTGELVRTFGLNQKAQTDPLFEKALAELEAYVTKFPYQYDYFIMLGKAYEAKSVMKNDPSLLKVSDMYYKKALTVAPGRQDALYAYAINLISQDKADEALRVLKENLDKYPELADNHYQVAQALAVMGKDRYDEVLLEFEYSLNRSRNLNPSITLQIYQKLLYYYYHKGDIERLNVVVKRLAQIDPSQSEQFNNLSAYIEKNKKIPVIEIKQE